MDFKPFLAALLTLVLLNIVVFLALNRKSPTKGMNWRAILYSALVADASFHALGLVIDKENVLAWIAVTIPLGAIYAFLVAAGVNVLLGLLFRSSAKWAEARCAVRVTPKLPLYAECPQPKRVRDISLVGAFIEDSHPLPRGRQLQLSCRLNGTRLVVISAVVQRVEEGRGMGVQFLSLTHAHHIRLQEFLAANG